MANFDHLAAPDPELAPILAGLPPAAPSLLPDLNAARALAARFVDMARSSQAAHLPPEAAYVSKDHTLAVEDGEIALRSHVPASTDDTARFPLLFWTHGGGWAIGDLDSDEYYLKAISVALQLVIVHVNYRLAPEHPFPTGLNDCYAGLKWTKEHAERFNADLSQGFLVGGQSAGANLAAVLAHRAKDDPAFAQHPLTGQALLYPPTVHPDAVPEEYKERFTAYATVTNAYILPARYMHEFYQLLQGPPTD